MKKYAMFKDQKNFKKIFKMLILHFMIYRCITVLNKISVNCCKYWQANFKIYMESQRNKSGPNKSEQEQSRKTQMIHMKFMKNDRSRNKNGIQK